MSQSEGKPARDSDDIKQKKQQQITTTRLIGSEYLQNQPKLALIILQPIMFASTSIVSSQTLAHRITKAASSLLSAPVKGYSGNCPFLRSLSTINSNCSWQTSAAAAVEASHQPAKELDHQASVSGDSFHATEARQQMHDFDCEREEQSSHFSQEQHHHINQNDYSKTHQTEANQQDRRQDAPSNRQYVEQVSTSQAQSKVKDEAQETTQTMANFFGANPARQQNLNHRPERFQSHTYDYSSRLRELIQKKRDDETYRVFRKVRRFRSNFPHGTEQDRPVTIWCSNDYFVMSSHPKVHEAILRALTEYGAGSGGTRNIAGNSPVHEQLEWELADLHAKEAALLFSSCYVANDSTLFTLLKLIPDCQVFSDAGNHASMIQGIRNSGAKRHIFRAFDPEDLEAKLKQVPRSVPKIVAFETVHSMTGDISDVERMCDIAHRYGALTFVDEVHAVGLYGARGAGIAQRDDCMDKIDIVSGTLGKAYGNCGGYVAASSELIDVVRSYASGFIFTTSLPPTVACGAAESVRILKGDEGRYMRQMQQHNVFHMKRALTAAGLPHYPSKSHIIPIPVGNSAKCTRVMNDLLDLGHYIQSINYPTVPKGTERLRVSVTPFHNEQMIDSLIEKLVSVWMRNDLNFLPPVEVPTQCRRHQLKNQSGTQVGQSLWCDLCHKEMNLCTRNTESDIIAN